MEEELKVQIKKEINDIWEKEAKNEFTSQINSCLKDTFKLLKEEIDKYDSSVNNHIKNLDKKFEEMWKRKIIGPSGKKEDYENIRKKPIDFKQLKNPPLKKLLIIGNSNPLINLVLQCLYNLETLVLYYFNPKKEDKIMQKGKDHNYCYLNPSFLKLMNYLWKGEMAEYYPEEIHKTLQTLMGHYYTTNSPNFLFNFILTTLDEELKIKQNLDKNQEEDPYSIFDYEKMFHNYFEKFNELGTKIGLSFYSTLLIKKKCECQKSSYSFESSPVMNIYLNQENNQEVDFNDFASYIIEKDKQFLIEKCLKCGQNKKKNLTKKISNTGEVLILNIDRTKDPEEKVSFKYKEQFNLEEITKKDMEIKDYKLTAVIKKNKDNNGFIAFCRSFIDKKWYSYDNHNIVYIQKYEDYIFDDKKACILIYIGKKKK